jgi:tetratricopeptide (TPR) repeat protein
MVRSAIILPVLLALLTVGLGRSPAMAGDDAARICNDFTDPVRQVRGCTSYIRSGRAEQVNLAVAHANRGIALSSLDKLSDALADFTRAIELAPDWAAPYFNRGNVYLARGDSARAIVDYDAAIARDSDLAYAYLNRGIALEASGEKDRSRADYAHALLLDPSLAKARERLGRLSPTPSSALRSDAVAE